MPASESMPRPHSLAHGQDGQCLCGMRHMIGHAFFIWSVTLLVNWKELITLLLQPFNGARQCVTQVCFGFKRVVENNYGAVTGITFNIFENFLACHFFE